MSSSRSELQGVASALESGATALTICRIADGIALEGPDFDGVAAYHVVAGAMHLRLPCGADHVVPADAVALIPAGHAARISSGCAVDAGVIEGRDAITRVGAWTIADATAGRPTRLTVAAARISGTTGASLSRATIVPLGRDRVGRKLSAMLRAEIDDPGAANGALAIAMMTACIVVALRKAIDESVATSAPADGRHLLIDRAVSAVRADPGHPHSVESLAQVAGMSRATFLRQFARGMRMSPMQFVQRTRLTEAAAMLRTGMLPVKTVAARAGFASRSHFSRAFRKVFGTDPSGFRDDHAVATVIPDAATGAHSDQSGARHPQ